MKNAVTGPDLLSRQHPDIETVLGEPMPNLEACKEVYAHKHRTVLITRAH